MNKYILSFDIEEWFHILGVEYLEEVSRWGRLEQRIIKSTERILNLLSKNNIKATFFILGWIAENYPNIVREISSKGHEIGSHSYSHILIYKNNREDFDRDLTKSIDIIQSITNKKICAFRAPGFSINKDTLWAFEILAKREILIDSSIFPAARIHGGIKDVHFDHPFLIKTKYGLIKEFPINMFKFGNFKWPFSGGGYFRLTPSVILIPLWKNSDYIMTYFHPRDFDFDQPLLKGLSVNRKFRSYYGIRGAKKKFNKLLNRFNFVNLSTAEKQIDWDSVPVIDLKEKHDLFNS